MKYIGIILGLLLSFSMQGQEAKYDSLLAKQYQADDYGMRTYVMALLYNGPNRGLSDKESRALQAAHLANIKKLAADGTLVLAGPTMASSELRGIYIFAVESLEEAEELTRTDPAIQAGSLRMELHQWYGSAALLAVNGLHQQIAKISF